MTDEPSKPRRATPYRMSDFPPVATTYAHGHRWGPWILDADRLCLCRCPDDVTDPRENIYEVDIETIDSSYRLLDWICQIAMKSWGTADVVGNLAIALNQLFVPQHRMRPGMEVNNRELLKLTVERDWT